MAKILNSSLSLNRCLEVYPQGDKSRNRGYVSVFLRHLNVEPEIEVKFEVWSNKKQRGGKYMSW